MPVPCQRPAFSRSADPCRDNWSTSCCRVRLLNHPVNVLRCVDQTEALKPSYFFALFPITQQVVMTFAKKRSEPALGFRLEGSNH